MANLASGNALAPQLFASHVGQENIELHARHVCAHTLQAARQILSYRILSGLGILAIESARIRDSMRKTSHQILWDQHLASHDRGNVAGAPRQKGGAICGRAVSPNGCVTANDVDSKVASKPSAR